MSNSKFKVGDTLLVMENANLFEVCDMEKENQPVNDFRCTECSKIYTIRNSFNCHMRNKHGVYASKSPKKTPKKIPRTPYSRPSLNSDQSELVINIYQCDQCNKSYKYAFSLDRHVKKVHHDKQMRMAGLMKQNNLRKKKVVKPTSLLKFRCKECPLSFFTSITLNQHIYSLHQIPLIQEPLLEVQSLPAASFKCDFCSRLFNTKDNSKDHFEAVHLPVIQEVFAKKAKQKEEQLQSKFTCIVCQRKFLFQASRDSHVKTHLGVAEKSLNPGDSDVNETSENLNEDLPTQNDIINKDLPKQRPKKIKSSRQFSPFIIFQEKMPFKVQSSWAAVDEIKKSIHEVIEEKLEIVTFEPEDASAFPDSIAKLDGMKSDDPGNEPDCSSFESSVDIPDLNRDKVAKKNKAIQFNESSPKTLTPSTKPEKESLYIKTQCPTTSGFISSPVATSSPKLPYLNSPLITGMADCPRGKLTPSSTRLSSIKHARNSVLYSSMTESYYPPPQSPHGIHPLLLPIYTQSFPPNNTNSSSSSAGPSIHYDYTSSTRNINNLVSIFIHGRNGDENGYLEDSAHAEIGMGRPGGGGVSDHQKKDGGVFWGR